MLPYIITAVVAIIVTAIAVWFIASAYQTKSANSKIGNAEEKARGIIDDAVKTAEAHHAKISDVKNSANLVAGIRRSSC